MPGQEERVEKVDTEGSVEEEVGEEGSSSTVAFIRCGGGMVMFTIVIGFLGGMEVTTFCIGRSVQFAIANAQSAVSCDAPNPTAGSGLYFSCPVTTSTLPTWTTEDLNYSLLPNVSWQALGGKKQVKFFGCEETRTSNRRRSVGYKYRYSKGWVNADGFTKPTSCSRAVSSCGENACLEPTGLFGSSIQKWGDALKAGAFDISKDLLLTADSLSETLEGEKYGEGASCDTDPTMGCMKVEFSSQSASYLSFFGEAADGSGGLRRTTVPAALACAEDTYWQLIGSDAAMSAEVAAQPLLDVISGFSIYSAVLRGAIMCMAVMAIYVCLSPIPDAAEAFGDCLSNIPCLGGFLVDTIEGLTGMVICGISVACGVGSSVFVIAIFQIYLNPLIGGSLLAVVVCCCCAACVLRRSAGAPNKKQKQEGSSGAGNDGSQMTQASQAGMQMPQEYQTPLQQPMIPMQQPAMQQPMMPMMPMMPMQPGMAAPGMQQPYNIPVPFGAVPGMSVPFTTTDGRQLQAEVPAGMTTGMVFQVVA